MESVHLAKWNEEQGNTELSEVQSSLIKQMDAVRTIVELGLSARKDVNVKVRQPLGYLAYASKTHMMITPELEQIIADELNVLEVNNAPDISELPDTKFKENTDFKVLLSTTLTDELKEMGYGRELERQVQDMRKKNALNVGDLINLYYNTTDLVLEQALIRRFDRKKTFVMQIAKELEVEADFEAQVDIDGRLIWLGVVRAH